MDCKEKNSNKCRTTTSLFRKILMKKKDEMGRRRSLILAKIYENANQFEDMLECMKMNICNRNNETSSVSVEERNMFSISYLRVLDRKKRGLRAAQRCLRKIRDNRKTRSRKMLTSLREDIINISTNIHDIVLNFALPATQRFEPDSESEMEMKEETVVFWLKMLGDCNRHVAEIQQNGTARGKSINMALRFYSRASRTAAITLLPTSQIRLGLALNFASFHVDVCKDPDSALSVLDLAYQDAFAENSTSTTSNQTVVFLLGKISLKIDNLKRAQQNEKRRKSPSLE